MPTVEDYFDDETDLPLPAASGSKPRALQGSGLRGALLEEISAEDDMDMDFSKIADQGRGIFGEGSEAPPQQHYSGEGKGKLAVRDEPGGLAAGGGGSGGGAGPRFNPNSPMGGFMGDMMKLQQAEEERMERLRKQFGSANIAADPSVYKGWNTVYPLYFDAKVSINDGRRVPRKDALWWPQASHISQACRVLGLPSVLEPDRVHPADWENPGRVKVQFVKDGRFINPIVKNRSQLYKHLASQLHNLHPALIYRPAPKPASASTTAATATTATGASKSKTSKSSGKSKAKSKSQSSASKPAVIPPKFASRPPRPTTIPALDDRLPLHTPIAPTGVAVAAVKRDLEAEKESKKKGIGGGEGGSEKMPKMKRVVVRKR
ncbi:hypothetical protein JCM24511_05604 [Saitozyma sp. JCM 24511]|nr:hypothetical protein JCM24511_05604 [Saitozyma sp. JCM 24511]